MNYILREIKLAKLIDAPLSDNATKLIEFWAELWSDMKVKIDPNEGKIRCWKDDYEYYYFCQVDKSARLWCDYNKVWRFFRDDLKFNPEETRMLIQYMVEETLSCEINTPLCKVIESVVKVKETLNCEVNTPNFRLVKIDEQVDATMNCEVSTPNFRRVKIDKQVDDTIKCEMDTSRIDRWVKLFLHFFGWIKI